jgi:DNA-binding YbaB/EbfC family protein
MFDMMKMMGKVKEVQEKIKAAQQELPGITAEGDAGGGMVKAVANGNKQLISLDIDPSLIKEEDQEILKDLIIAAANKAIMEAEEKAKAHLQQATQGMMPNIPGLDLSGIG